MSSIYYKTPEIQTLFESEDLSEIDYLLRNGLDINSVNVFNENAAFDASFEKTLFLEKKGINLFHELSKGFNILFNLDANIELNKFKYLIEKGLSFNHYNRRGYSILHYINIEHLEYLQKVHNFKIPFKNLQNMNIFNSTSQPIAEILYTKYKQNPHIEGREGYNSFFYNKRDTVEYLVSLGVDYTKKNDDGFSAMHGSELETFKYLMSLGLSPNELNNRGQNLFCQVEYNTAKYMVEELNIDPLNKNNGEFYLDWMDLDSLNYMINIGCIDKYNKKELIKLLKGSEFYVIDYLLNLDVYKNNEIEKVKNIYFKKDCYSPSHERSLMGCFENSGVNINVINNNGESLLHFHDDIKIKEKLVDSGINVNFLNNQMRNPLLTSFMNIYKTRDSSYEEEYQFYQKLLNKGVDIFNKDVVNRTALFRVFNPLIIEDLIKKGIDADHLDNHGLPFWFYFNEDYIIPYVKNPCSSSVWQYISFHLKSLQDYISEQEYSYLYNDGEYITKYIKKTIDCAVKMRSMLMLEDFKERGVIIDIINILKNFENSIILDEPKKYINKITRKILILCSKDPHFENIFLLHHLSKYFPFDFENYKMLKILFHKKPLIEYELLKIIDNSCGGINIKKGISWSSSLKKLPMNLKVDLLNCLPSLIWNKGNNRLLKPLVEEIIKEPLKKEYLKSKIFENVTVRMIEKYIPKNNINYQLLHEFTRNRKLNKFKDELNKKEYIKRSLKPNEKIDEKNVFNENVLYFICNVKNYEICKKNKNIDLYNLSQFGEDALFRHIKNLELFYRKSNKTGEEEMKKYIFQLIEDVEVIVEENAVGENIFNIIKDLQENKDVAESCGLSEILVTLEKKKIKLNAEVPHKENDNKKRKRI